MKKHYFYFVTILVVLIIILLFAIDFKKQNGENFLEMLRNEKTIYINSKDYDEIFYNTAIEEMYKPFGFYISEYFAVEIFKILVQEYFNIIINDDITISNYRDYYIVTGKIIIETEYMDRIGVTRDVYTLILKISDGTIISFFKQI